jgi:hypothetical protein
MAVEAVPSAVEIHRTVIVSETTAIAAEHWATKHWATKSTDEAASIASVASKAAIHHCRVSKVD